MARIFIGGKVDIINVWKAAICVCSLDCYDVEEGPVVDVCHVTDLCIL